MRLVLIKPDVEDPEYFLRFHSGDTSSIRSDISATDQQRASETRRLLVSHLVPALATSFSRLRVPANYRRNCRTCCR